MRIEDMKGYKESQLNDCFSDMSAWLPEQKIVFLEKLASLDLTGAENSRIQQKLIGALFETDGGKEYLNSLKNRSMITSGKYARADAALGLVVATMQVQDALRRGKDNRIYKREASEAWQLFSSTSAGGAAGGRRDAPYSSDRGDNDFVQVLLRLRRSGSNERRI